MSFQFSAHPVADPQGVLTVRLNGRLMDQNEAQGMLDTIEEHILDGMKYLIVDMSKLEYMNSTGLNILVAMLTKCRNEGGETILCSISSKVEQLFIMTKLNTVFTIVEDDKEAIQKMEALLAGA